MLHKWRLSMSDELFKHLKSWISRYNETNVKNTIERWERSNGKIDRRIERWERRYGVIDDEELLDDNLGPSLFSKNTENDLIGEDGDIDEDALLGVDETGGKSVSISFSNDNIHPISSRHLSRVVQSSHQHDDNQVVLVDEQAFVFDKTETADLEDELNIAGEDEGQYALQQNEDLMYNEEGHRRFSDSQLYHNEASGVDEENLDYSNNRLLDSSEREITYVGQEGYEDTTGLYSHMTDVNYPDSRNEDSAVDTSSVELGYEQPITHEEQVHLEYDNIHEPHIGGTENLQESILTNEEYASESESDEENSRHNRGKFTSERTGVISLTTVPARESIPDTLEINDEQAAQIEQFMSDKSRGNKASKRGRQSVYSRLGVKPNAGSQPLLPDPRLNMFQRPRLGPFQNSLNPTFPGLMNQRGNFLNRMMPEANPFPIRPQGQRVPFPPGPPFPFNLPIGQRFPFQNLRPMGRFAEVQRSQLMRSEQKMPQPNMTTNLRLLGPNPNLPPYRMQFGQDIRNSAPSFQAPQPLFRARGKNPNQVQPIPSLVQSISVPNIPQRPSPHQRLGPMQNKNKIHQNIHSPHPSEGSIPQLLQMNHPQLMQGDIHFVKKHKIYINPRFQTQPIRHQTPQTTRTVPTQVQKAKAILEKAKQTQLKQTQLNSSLKRKSSDNTESVPIKVIKTEVKTDTKTETVQLEQGEALNEESLKIKALLEEQKQKREFIKKQKENARQKQAALKRKELEAKMKSEDKLISNVVEAASTVSTGHAKLISAGVASRLGPPPSQQPTSSVIKTVHQFVTQVNRTQPKFQHSLNAPRQPFAPKKIIPNKVRPATSSVSQKTITVYQQRPSTGTVYQQRPSTHTVYQQRPGFGTVYQQRPSTGLNTPRIPSFDQLRFSVSNTTSSAPTSAKSQDPRYRGPNTFVDPRFRGPNALVEPRFKGTNTLVDPRFKAPNAMVDPRFRGPNTLVNPRYRFQQLPPQAPPPPPHLPAQFSSPPPSNQNLRFQVSQPVNHQYQQPQGDSYNFPSFNVQSSQASQYQPSQSSHYPSQLLNYVQQPVQNYVNPPPVATHNQNVSSVGQMAYNSEMYNTPSNQQNRNSSSTPMYQAQNQSVHSYYSQIPSGQISSSYTSGNEQASFGQRIQTIGQHIQPTTGGQIRSILQNVKSAPKLQIVQSTASGSREDTAVMNQQVDVYTGPQKIVILNVPQQATRETIIKICRHFGIVMGANLIRSQNKAIVQFQTGEQAAKCVSKCDQKCLHKTRLTVRLLP